MSVASLLEKARALGVRLILNGDGVKLRGPAASIAAIKPELAAHKPEIVEHLRRATVPPLPGYPVADGPFSPYSAPLQINGARAYQLELGSLIDKLATVENWGEEHRRSVLLTVLRQPVCTLRDELAHWRARWAAYETIRRAAEIARRAAEIARRAVAAHDAIRKCSTCQHMTHHDSGVPVRCGMSRVVGLRHREWLDEPDKLNECREHRHGH